MDPKGSPKVILKKYCFLSKLLISQMRKLVRKLELMLALEVSLYPGYCSSPGPHCKTFVLHLLEGIINLGVTAAVLLLKLYFAWQLTVITGLRCGRMTRPEQPVQGTLRVHTRIVRETSNSQGLVGLYY